MGKLWYQDGKLLRNGGAIYACDDCPCVTTSNCFCLVPVSGMTATIAGVTLCNGCRVTGSTSILYEFSGGINGAYSMADLTSCYSDITTGITLRRRGYSNTICTGTATSDTTATIYARITFFDQGTSMRVAGTIATTSFFNPVDVFFSNKTYTDCEDFYTDLYGSGVVLTNAHTSCYAAVGSGVTVGYGGTITVTA